jgi:hypothetical protein
MEGASGDFRAMFERLMLGVEPGAVLARGHCTLFLCRYHCAEPVVRRHSSGPTARRGDGKVCRRTGARKSSLRCRSQSRHPGIRTSIIWSRLRPANFRMGTSTTGSFVRIGNYEAIP